MTIELRGEGVHVECDKCGNDDGAQMAHVADWFEVNTIETVYECLACGAIIKGAFRRAEWHQDYGVLHDDDGPYLDHNGEWQDERKY
jgi:predicted RNA-binding Zn-ribbon protein involved in translation (DUF1610 family)